MVEKYFNGGGGVLRGGGGGFCGRGGVSCGEFWGSACGSVCGKCGFCAGDGVLLFEMCFLSLYVRGRKLF
jgi:hypothetical protein